MASCSTNGAQELLKAIRQVLDDPSFTTGAAEAKEARDAAASLFQWQQEDGNRAAFETFSNDLHGSLSDVFSGVLRTSANRERMWGKFFSLRSSPAFIGQWVSFLEEAKVSTTPILYQHLTDLVFRAILAERTNIQQQADEATPAVTQSEGNALRYAAGYVCRHLNVKLEKGSHPLKDDLIQCLKSLTRDASNGNGENGTAEEWTELVDRGGLWRVRDTKFQVFCALEEEIRSCLHQLVCEAERTDVDELTTKLISSEDVQFYWCIAAAAFDIDDDEVHHQPLNKLVKLFITIRGFAFAGAWVEKYKQAQKKSTQRSKSLRKKVVH